MHAVIYNEKKQQIALSNKLELIIENPRTNTESTTEEVKSLSSDELALFENLPTWFDENDAIASPDCININDCDVEIVDEFIKFNNYKPIKPRIIITYDGEILEEDIDYALKYFNNVYATKDAKIFIRGKNDFDGLKTIKFVIAKDDNNILTFGVIDNKIVSTCKYGVPTIRYYKEPECTNELLTVPTSRGSYFIKIITPGSDDFESMISATKVYHIDTNLFNINMAKTSLPITSFEYTGKEIKPKVNVIFSSTKLDEGKDYILVYSKNIDVCNNAKIIVCGSGQYEGSKILRFKIIKTLNKIYYFDVSDSGPYASCKFEKPIFKYYEDNLCLKEIERPNDPGRYFIKAFSMDSDNYIGTSTEAKVFKINPGLIEVDNFDIEIENKNVLMYNCSFQKPKVSVEYKKKKLKENEDYKVTFDNNKNAGIASLTLFGLKSYIGKREIKFKIHKAPNLITLFRINIKGFPQAIADYGSVEFKYFKDKQCNIELPSKPKSCGVYYVKAYSKESRNYSATESGPIVWEICNFNLRSSLRDIGTCTIECLPFRNIYCGDPICPIFKLYAPDRKENLLVGNEFIFEFGENIRPKRGSVVVRGINTFKGIKIFAFDIEKKQNGINHFKIRKGNPQADCCYGRAVFEYFSDKELKQKIKCKPNSPGKYYVQASSMETETYASNKTFALPYIVKNSNKQKSSQNTECLINTCLSSGLFLSGLGKAIKYNIYRNSDLNNPIYDEVFLSQLLDSNGLIKISLPIDDYIIKTKLSKELDALYEYERKACMFWSPDNCIEYYSSFDPIIKFSDYKKGCFEILDVVNDLHMADIYGNKFSISDNATSEQKLLLFFFLNIHCNYSISVLNTLKKKVLDHKWSTKLNIFVFAANETGTIDEINDLRIKYSDNFWFFKDEKNLMQKRFFNEVELPGVAVLNYQGVLVDKKNGILDWCQEFKELNLYFKKSI